MTALPTISPGTPGRARLDGAWRPCEFVEAVSAAFCKVRTPGRNGGRIRTVTARNFEVLTAIGDDKAARHAEGARS